MLELTEITKRYHVGQANEFAALDGVSLSIAPGTATILQGPSGSGKTTLLALIGCMGRPTAGRIRLSSQWDLAGLGFGDCAELELTGLAERFLTAIRRRLFGFVFQSFNLIAGISALENVMLPAYPTGMSHGECRERAAALLAAFNLSQRAATRVELLSGGEMQRVAIARALVNDPAIIIADEPTAHLDTRLSAEFMAMMADCKAQGKTVVIASHDPLVCSWPLAETVVEMRDGRVIGVERRQ